MKPVRRIGEGAREQAQMPQTQPMRDGTSGSTPALLVLPAEITHAQAAGCLHMLLTAMRAENRAAITFVVDAAPLARFDSSALAVLLECRRAVLQTGRRFAVRGMPARLAELARLYGVTELLPSNTAA
jgi:phospholipid transport system transporter-binding protein